MQVPVLHIKFKELLFGRGEIKFSFGPSIDLNLSGCGYLVRCSNYISFFRNILPYQFVPIFGGPDEYG